MERKIGEVFEYEGHKLKVTDEDLGCHRCFFYTRGCIALKIRGSCTADIRTDRKSVIYVEVKDEQPREQAGQSLELNLCEVLKYCPLGKTLWSPLLGGVKFHDINQKRNFIVISLENGETWGINADGTITFGDVTSPEIMLYPSREQRDWAKVKYEPRKERFDPKTLKPFDRVIVWDEINAEWFCANYSHRKKSNIFIAATTCGNYLRCIPYNDETKHLVDTKEEAPDFYRYWEE